MGNPLDVCGIYTVRLNICRSSRRTLVCVKRVKNEKEKRRKGNNSSASRTHSDVIASLSLPVRRCSPQSWASQLVEDEDDSRHRCCSASPIFPHNLAAPSASINFICQRTQGRAGECVCVCVCTISWLASFFFFSYSLVRHILNILSLLRIQQHVHIKTSIIQQASSYIYISTCFDPFDLNIQSYICINWQVS